MNEPTYLLGRGRVILVHFVIGFFRVIERTLPSRRESHRSNSTAGHVLHSRNVVSHSELGVGRVPSRRPRPPDMMKTTIRAPSRETKILSNPLTFLEIVQSGELFLETGEKGARTTGNMFSLFLVPTIVRSTLKQSIVFYRIVTYPAVLC